MFLNRVIQFYGLKSLIQFWIVSRPEHGVAIPYFCKISFFSRDVIVKFFLSRHIIFAISLVMSLAFCLCCMEFQNLSTSGRVKEPFEAHDSCFLRFDRVPLV